MFAYYFTTASISYFFAILYVYSFNKISDDQPAIRHSFLNAFAFFLQSIKNAIYFLKELPFIFFLRLFNRCVGPVFLIPIFLYLTTAWSYYSLVATGLCVLIYVIDRELHIVPEELTYAGLLLAFLYPPFLADTQSALLGAGIALFIMWLPMFVFSIIRDEHMVAGGDVALALMAGAWIGINGVFYFIIITGVVFVVRIMMMHSKEKGAPMAPSIIVGVLLAQLYISCAHSVGFPMMF